jgi:hypothetical protein
MERMVAITESSINESYVEPSPNAWLRSRTPVPTSYAPACAPLYTFQEILENRTSRARSMTVRCTEVIERKFSICIEIWQFELESCVWRVSFHKYAYVHGDPIQGVDPTGMFLGTLISVGIGIGGMSQELVTGGLIIGLLQSVGKPAFDLRAMGLALIAQGDFELGFKLYEVSTAVIGKVFETIETVDGAMGLASIGPLVIVGAIRLAKSSPELAQTALNATKHARDFIKNAIRNGRNPAQFFNSTKWVANAKDSYVKFLDALEKLQTKAENAANGPKFNPPDFNNLGPRNSHGVYNSEKNSVSLFKDHDEFTLAEELRHWEFHQNFLASKRWKQSDFDNWWNNALPWEQAQYHHTIEQDATQWMAALGFSKR